MFEFAKKLYCDEKPIGNKKTRDKSLTKLFISPTLTAGSLKTKSFSKPKETETIFLSSSPDEFCDRRKTLLQEKEAGTICNINIEEIIAIANKHLEDKCISTTQNLRLCKIFIK